MIKNVVLAYGLYVAVGMLVCAVWYTIYDLRKKHREKLTKQNDPWNFEPENNKWWA